MTKISNKIKCELMNRLYQGKDVFDIIEKYNLSNDFVDKCSKELNQITKNNSLGVIEDYSLPFSSEELEEEKNKFKKYSWRIIQKANQILIDKLNQLSFREKQIDKLLMKVEDCLTIETYDKTQMGKLLKLLENAKQNNISELARVIQILYNKQDDKEDLQDSQSLESMLEGITGEDF